MEECSYTYLLTYCSMIMKELEFFRCFNRSLQNNNYRSLQKSIEVYRVFLQSTLFYRWLNKVYRTSIEHFYRVHFSIGGSIEVYRVVQKSIEVYRTSIEYFLQGPTMNSDTISSIDAPKSENKLLFLSLSSCNYSNVIICIYACIEQSYNIC